jgi:D-3-phosphoglycerate dehydrogenase / 2-oxoglutarate reductase
MKVAVIDDYQNAFRTLACAGKLDGHDLLIVNQPLETENSVVDALKDAEAVILTMQRTAFPRSVLERLPKLRMISQTGRNTSHIDLAACKERGIVVSAGGGGGATATAELTWALILSAARNVPAEVQALKEGRWQISLGDGLAGKTLGIYAFGRIGSLVAQVGKAFGMSVTCWGRDGSIEKAKQAGYAVSASRAAFFSESDVISLHIPLNKDTQGIVKASDLALMKPSAILVNTSRAPIVEAGALVAALKSGRPGRAAVDVYETEPVLRAEHPLIGMPNVVCTPHLGYVERDTYEGLFAVAIDQVLAHAAGKPINVIG